MQMLMHSGAENTSPGTSSASGNLVPAAATEQEGQVVESQPGDDTMDVEPPPPPKLVGTATCMFQCGPPRPLDDEEYWSFGGNDRTRSYMCKLCFNVQRFIKQQAAKDIAKRAALKKMIHETPEIWYSIVRKLRFNPLNPSGHAEKRAKVWNCVSAIQTANSVEEVQGVMWLELPAWNTWQRDNKELDRPAAIAAWHRCCTMSPQSVLRLPGHEPRLPVRLAPTVLLKKERALLERLEPHRLH